MQPRTRREFLGDVGRGMIASSVGLGVAAELGLAAPIDGKADVGSLSFGEHESLVRLMQETPIEKLLPQLAKLLKSGKSLKDLTIAAALANARTFGGEDYVGFHTMMALPPAFHMAAELPPERSPLPVLKVLYRNTNRIQEHGGRPSEVLKAIDAHASKLPDNAGVALRERVRHIDMDDAENVFAAISASGTPEQAFNALLTAVEDATDVHRVVLPYRAWDMLCFIGMEHAHTLLRQSVRFCVKAEPYVKQNNWSEPRRVLPQMLEQYKLLDKPLGAKAVDDAWIDRTSMAIFSATGPQAADIAAAALADGVAPDSVGEAICLATNQLVLRDMGRTPADEITGKPMGSVHGDSIGVHACDSANAWRNLARASDPRNTCACLILGAYQAAVDRTNRGGDFLHWQPMPLPQHVAQLTTTNPAELIAMLDTAVRGNMQAHAAAIVHRYGELGHPEQAVFNLMLKYAISEDGALHAEKFYRTSRENFTSTRPAFRWRHLVALARVTASEYGRPAPGYAQATELLQLARS